MGGWRRDGGFSRAWLGMRETVICTRALRVFVRRGASLGSLEGEGLDSLSQVVFEGAIQLLRVP